MGQILESRSITPEAFNRWLTEVKNLGLARSDAAAARLLGYRDVQTQKKNGGDHRLALACAAVLHGLEPYGGPDTKK